MTTTTMMTGKLAGPRHGEYAVVRAWTLGAGFEEKPDGWDLLCGAEWCQRFRTKREALEAKRWCLANAGSAK